MQRPPLARPSGHFVSLVRSFAAKSSNADLYHVLGIERDAKQKDVKEAFYKLSKLYHPDVSSDTVALQKFQDITAAYETLGTEESRSAYDLVTQPSRSRRLGSAPLKKDAASAEDYTQFYRLRKKAHEKIRIRTHPETPAAGGSEKSTPNFYSAGSFDEEMLNAMRRDDQPNAASRMGEMMRISASSGILFSLLMSFIFAYYWCSPDTPYVLKGHRIRSSNQSEKKTVEQSKSV